MISIHLACVRGCESSSLQGPFFATRRRLISSCSRSSMTKALSLYPGLDSLWLPSLCAGCCCLCAVCPRVCAPLVRRLCAGSLSVAGGMSGILPAQDPGALGSKVDFVPFRCSCGWSWQFLLFARAGSKPASFL